MEQQNDSPQVLQTQQPQIPNTQQTPHKPKNKKTIALILVIVLLILTIGAGGYLLSKSLSTKDRELSSVKSELSTTKDELKSTDEELAAAQAKIEALDNPQRKINDTKRKSDLAKFVAALKQYAANNNGMFPTTEPAGFVTQFEQSYITGKLADFADPSMKKPYEIITVGTVQTPPGVTLGTIQYQWPGKCAGGGEFEDVESSRQAAARLILESGEIYCLDS